MSIAMDVTDYKDEILSRAFSLFKEEERVGQEHDRSVLYRVGAETIGKLLLLDETLSSEVGGPYEGIGLAKVLKIINPKISAYKFHFDMKEKYQFISSEEAVAKHIEKQYEISRNTKRKLFIQNLKGSAFTDDEVAAKVRAFDIELESADETFKQLLEDKDGYEIVITDFVERKSYPNLYYTTTEGKSHDEYLRINVPNILFYDEDGERGLKRSDAEAGNIVLEFSSLHDRIYFRPKSDGKDT